MGCRLPKLRKAEERRSPGNIYSTLRRPQVETKVGVSYTYHFLDFLLGKDEVPVSSVLCLSSVRELPVQVRELYAQGFVLVAVHPFVHPCGPRHAHIQRQLHRAVLVRETPSSEKSHLRCGRHRLETDVCVAGHQVADPEVIQSYVKRIQDVAEQGVMFVGFLQQPGGGPCYLGNWDPEELSSLHSSPSPIHRHPISANTSPTDPTEHNAKEPEHPFETPESQNEGAAHDKQDHTRLNPTQSLDPNHEESIELFKDSTNRLQDHSRPSAEAVQGCPHQNPAEDDEEENQQCPSPPDTEGLITQIRGHLPNVKARERQSSSSDSWYSSPDLDRNHRRKSGSAFSDGQSRVTTHNNNHIRLKSAEKEKDSTSTPTQGRMQLFALYNHTGDLDTSMRFYSLRVPLQVQKEAGQITELDTHWLDHMTQHFTSGAHLIDGFFHLKEDSDNGVSCVDSVFIFQSSAEETTGNSYDAIVVEQWTVVDGVVVKADYVPLLQSLAPYGWRLMCVLPTPIVKTNSDGSLSTKQILFLQRPVLQRKRKDFKMLNLRGRSKAKKKSGGETQEEREDRSPVMETEMDRWRRITTEDEDRAERRKSRDSLQRGEEESEEEEEQYQRRLSFLPGSRVYVDDQEEETDIDEILLSHQERSVRWTDACSRDEGGVKEQVKMEERIKQQLFSGVC
ncbi:raftlin isoform X2 [Notolabrus celidotus]|uniref:raftlin isoform X2 n=1 Tax=Notolabrus celidotus TaxID=1203425 RepID=UPI00149011BE|nr:raftlin isoform X2 [Notolabrus celidotus]